MPELWCYLMLEYWFSIDTSYLTQYCYSSYHLQRIQWQSLEIVATLPLARNSWYIVFVYIVILLFVLVGNLNVHWIFTHDEFYDFISELVVLAYRYWCYVRIRIFGQVCRTIRYLIGKFCTLIYYNYLMFIWSVDLHFSTITI